MKKDDWDREGGVELPEDWNTRPPPDFSSIEKGLEEMYSDPKFLKLVKKLAVKDIHKGHFGLD